MLIGEHQMHLCARVVDMFKIVIKRVHSNRKKKVFFFLRRVPGSSKESIYIRAEHRKRMI